LELDQDRRSRIVTLLLLACPNEGEERSCQHHCRRFGQYGPQLQRYLEYFPRDQLAVVLFEGLRRDTEQVVRHIWEFLEIEPGIVRRLDLEPRNMANSPKRPPNLPVGLKEWVASYYRDSNQLVEELLGIDVSAWADCVS
jgi:hypothetical protein